MKKLIILFVLSICLFSCKKDDDVKPVHSVSITPQPQPYSGVLYGGYH